jgi:hypothetical protein
LPSRQWSTVHIWGSQPARLGVEQASFQLDFVLQVSMGLNPGYGLRVKTGRLYLERCEPTVSRWLPLYAGQAMATTPASSPRRPTLRAKAELANEPRPVANSFAYKGTGRPSGSLAAGQAGSWAWRTQPVFSLYLRRKTTRRIRMCGRANGVIGILGCRYEGYGWLVD